MLPTWSARNGGLVLGIDLQVLVFGRLPIMVSLACEMSVGTRHHSSVGEEMLRSQHKKHWPEEDRHGVQEP